MSIHWNMVIKPCAKVSNMLMGLNVAVTTFTALFNDMRTLKFKAPLTNAFFATVNQMWRLDLITARSAVVGSWEEPPSIWLTVAKNEFVGWDLSFRVRMLLKRAVKVVTTTFNPLSMLETLAYGLITIFQWMVSLDNFCHELTIRNCLWVIKHQPVWD